MDLLTHSNSESRPAYPFLFFSSGKGGLFYFIILFYFILFWGLFLYCYDREPIPILGNVSEV